MTGTFIAKSPTQNPSTGSGSSVTMRGFESSESTQLAPAGVYFSDVWGNNYGNLYGVAFGNAGNNEASFTAVLIAEKDGSQIQLSNNYVSISGDVEINSYKAYHAANLQCGSALVSVSGSGSKYSGTYDVTFSPPFKKDPRVVVSPLTSDAQAANAAVANITANGFTIVLTRTNNYETNVQWIAVETR